jgi:hypothetical protein
MNLVGKIFTVLIFVMCIVFASFALMLHAAHKNWREEIVKQDGYRDRIDKLAKEQSDLQQSYALLEQQRKSDNDRNEALIKKLDVANRELTASQQTAEARYLQKEGENRNLSMTLKLNQENMDNLRNENEELRAASKVAVAQRQTFWDNLVKGTTDLNNALAEINLLQNRLRGLVEPYKTAVSELEYAKIRPSDLYKQPPAGLEGIVTSVQPSDVEISLGYDQGVRVGHRFAVTRPSMGANHYIGDIVVSSVPYPHRAVCRPDKSSMLQQIQKYDHVQASLTKSR